MPRCCKICASKVCLLIDYLHIQKKTPYRELIRIFKDEGVPNLNLMNLSTHFSRHTSHYNLQMFEELEKTEPLKKVGMLEHIYQFCKEWTKKRGLRL